MRRIKRDVKERRRKRKGVCFLYRERKGKAKEIMVTFCLYTYSTFFFWVNRKLACVKKGLAPSI
jgi:hypothetical protein